MTSSEILKQLKSFNRVAGLLYTPHDHELESSTIRLFLKSIVARKCNQLSGLLPFPVAFCVYVPACLHALRQDCNVEFFSVVIRPIPTV
jgi:hypothetical protein